MNRFILTLAVSCFSVSAIRAQDEVKSVESKQDAVDALQAEFRELVVARASDFSNTELQARAIGIVDEHAFWDQRFEAAIGEAVGRELKAQQWNGQAVLNALKLMQTARIDLKRQTELAFDCYMKAIEQAKYRGNGRRGRTALRNAIAVKENASQLMKTNPKQLAELLIEKFETDELPLEAFSFVEASAGSDKELLSAVLKAGRSDNAKIATVAMGTAHTLLRRLVPNGLGEKEEDAHIEVSERYLTYATRILERYDKDRDRVLSKQECEGMLVSPFSADQNRNGRVSIREYAHMMETRSKRK